MQRNIREGLWAFLARRKSFPDRNLTHLGRVNASHFPRRLIDAIDEPMSDGLGAVDLVHLAAHSRLKFRHTSYMAGLMAQEESEVFFNGDYVTKFKKKRLEIYRCNMCKSPFY